MKLLILISVLFIAAALATGQAPSNCPAITVTGPPGVTMPGETMTFTAKVENASTKTEFEWTVSAGTIDNGQGTESIVVTTTKEMNNSNVTAVVKVKGAPVNCSEASETAAISGPGDQHPVDIFGRLKRDDIKARFDNFYISLNNNPDSFGLVVIRFPEAATREKNIAFLKDIDHAIVFRKYDPARLVFNIYVEKDRDVPQATLWLFPPEMEDDFLQEGAIKFKGKELGQRIKTLFTEGPK